MSNLSPENSHYPFLDVVKTELSTQRQQEMLGLKVGPVIQEGINNGIIKQNDILLVDPDNPNNWIHSTTPATYEIIDSVDNKTKQPIVYMLVKYDKKINDSSDEITVQESTMKISIKGKYFVFIKDNNIDHPQYVPVCLNQPETHILQLFENQKCFHEDI